MFIYLKDNKIMATTEEKQDYSEFGWTVEETSEDIIQIDGLLYRESEAGELLAEKQREEVRRLRNIYLTNYVDVIVTNPLRWVELSESDKQQIIDYRRYLLDYTNNKNWWQTMPQNFSEFIGG